MTWKIDIVPHGLTEEYRDVKLMTWTDPDFDLPTIQTVLGHLSEDGLSRNKAEKTAGHSTATTAASTSTYTSVTICRNCGKAGRYMSGCAVSTKAPGKSNKLAGPNQNLDPGAVLRRSGAPCTKRQHTTTPSSTRKGLRAHIRHTIDAIGAKTRPDDTENKPVDNFDDNFDRGRQI